MPIDSAPSEEPGTCLRAEAPAEIAEPSTAAARSRRRFLTRTGCFSAEAMFVTMAIEFLGAIYAAFRYRLDKITWLVIGLLVFLGIFQMAEFLLCSFPGVFGISWARLGYMSITMLPPLGISLAMAIAGKKSLPAQIAMYTACAAFIGWFGFTGQGLTGDTCEGNYVIFAANDAGMWAFGTYYYVFLGIGTAFSFWWAYKSNSLRTRRALIWLAVGYLVFITPTVAVALLDPATQAAIPSVMCGFAVLLAITLLLGVLPYAGTLRFEPHTSAPEDAPSDTAAQSSGDDSGAKDSVLVS